MQREQARRADATRLREPPALSPAARTRSELQGRIVLVSGLPTAGALAWPPIVHRRKPDVVLVVTVRMGDRGPRFSTRVRPPEARSRTRMFAQSISDTHKEPLAAVGQEGAKVW